MKFPRIPLLLSLTVLAGCTAVGPDYEPPENDFVPESWQQGEKDKDGKDVSNYKDLATWWQALGDANLNSLITQADEGNLDLKIAMARLKAAGAGVGVAGSGYAPEIEVGGSTDRTKISKELSYNTPPPQERIDNIDLIGAGGTWEIDLFGRVSRSLEAASASYEAAQEDARGVRVILYANIATTYVQLRTLQQRLAYAHKNANAQRKTKNLVKNKFDAELISELDWRQAERNLAITQSVIPQLEAGIDASLYKLAVLVGKPPGALDEQLRKPAPIPKLPKTIIGTMPRDIVRQRPDIRRAERQLAAATAEIGVATSELYPRLTLNGNFAFTAASGSLLTYNAQGWSFGPSLSWNVFSGGRIRSNIKIQEANAEAARASYEATVLGALSEVETSLSGYAHEGKRMNYLQKSVNASSRSVDLVQAAYDAGLADFQNVLDAQRTLFEQQDSKAESQGERVIRFIDVTRAMGGGWSGPEKDEDGKDVTNDDGKDDWMKAGDLLRV